MPLIKKTLNILYKARYYLKIDIITAFNKFLITEKKRIKTAFRTYNKLFEYTVIPFRPYKALLD